MVRTLATADIGSNTAHLLVAQSDGHTVIKLESSSEWIGLGEMIARNRALPDEIVARITETLKGFLVTARARGAESIYVFATEAIRRALNGAEACEAIERETKLPVDVIAPKREAELSLRGAELDTPTLRACFLFEIGGGSLQIGELEEGTLRRSHSLPLGTGSLVAATELRSPCPRPILEAARDFVEKTFEGVDIQSKECQGIASGGVARGIWRALHPDGDPMLSPEEFDYLVWAASHLSRDQLSERFRVKYKRAGTLLPGALVFQTLVRRYSVGELRVSQYGIREGAILEMATGKIEARRL